MNYHNRHKITDWEKFREFAKVHEDKTQVEMAKLWQGEISDRTLSYRVRLHRLRLASSCTNRLYTTDASGLDIMGWEKNGFYWKKKTYGYRERDEARRQAFLAELSTLPPSLIVR
ncbi:hypothetical protein [Microseira wollei]|uniref:Transposase, putative n=1 Tax=Microseira wollei NIES-4236 TaxID=2530354 RepID=A0AAV3XR45_9CYAN|nr:transposase, putative [Microseira wollei NIES-4236]